MSSSVKKKWENVILQPALLLCSLANNGFRPFYFCLACTWNRKADDIESRNQEAVHRSVLLVSVVVCLDSVWACCGEGEKGEHKEVSCFTMQRENHKHISETLS